ncbi:MAG: hypothetical protein B1H03_03355 [Planctomycetales bacterium 4484_113]|nr:MAG: hypothetical protein B1H03_03355 [Planctomycetales bacterium 4484_113]
MEDSSQRPPEPKGSEEPRLRKRLPDLKRLERKAKPPSEKARQPAASRTPSAEPSAGGPPLPATPDHTREPLELRRQLETAGARVKIRLSEVDEHYLRHYTFGTACGIYMMNRVLWPYLLFVAIVALSPLLIRAPLWFVGIMLVALLIYPLGFTFMCLLAGVVASSAPYLMQGPMRNLMLGGGFVFYLAAGIYAFLIAAAGIYARRQRWENWDWASFSDFVEVEKRWQTIGIVFWLGLIAAIIYVFATNSFEDLFPIFWGTDFA